MSPCLDGIPGVVPGLVPGIQGFKSPGSLGKTWDQAKSLKFILIDSNFFLSPVPRPVVTVGVSPSFPRLSPKGKNIYFETPSQGSPWVREMGDATESLLPAPNYNTPVKDLEYKDLLTSTFTQPSHESSIKTWCVQTTYPECLFCGKKYRYERFNVECHMDPNIGNWQGKDCRTVQRITTNIVRSS